MGRLTNYGLRGRIYHWKNRLTDLRPKLIILLYHRVQPEISFNPFNTIVSTNAFERQLDELAKRYNFVSLRDAVREQSTSVKTQIALTFDDGFEDNYQIVFPILKKRRLSATFFVTTDLIDTGLPQWDWEVVCRLSSREINKVEAENVSLRRASDETSLLFAFHVIDYLKAADAKVLQQVLDDLREQSREVTLGSKCMSWKQVRTLWNEGMEIGSHGTTHRSLARIDPAEAFEEIRRSKRVLDSQIKASCEHFAFPFGSRHDYSQTLIDAVRQSGFKTCLLNVHGYNHASQENFAFKRVIMTETTDLRYLLG